MQIKLATNEIPGLRGERGVFTSQGMRDQFQRNQRFAVVLQAKVGQGIEAQIAKRGRTGGGSGRLLRATLAPGNRDVRSFSVGVGVDEFLDRQYVKYWRTFEYGSAAVWKRPFIGTEIIIQRRAPWGVGRFARPGIRTTPGSMSWEGTHRSFSPAVVTREIEPADAYGRVGRSGILTEQGLQFARAYIASMFEESKLFVAGPPGYTPSS